MNATQLYKDRFDYNDGMIIEVVVWQVPQPVLGSQHHYKYRLFYGNAEHKRVVGYDNERPKGDHRHYGDHEETYIFTTVEQLMTDFFADVQHIRRQT
ncbi:MAG: hypothetical protein JG718_14250 [Candidatus Thiothrix moscowensis]|nr:hypothetical protein [Candidatus Thiothrix moscowensis]